MLFKRGEDVKLSPNFHLKEAECKCGKCPYTPVDAIHVSNLQQLRDKIGQTIIVNSWYRCEYHNENIGGEIWSMHRYGIATDIRLKNGNINDHIPLIESIFQYGGVGIYDTFIHVDSRGFRARWNNSTKPK